MLLKARASTLDENVPPAVAGPLPLYALLSLAALAVAVAAQGAYYITGRSVVLLIVSAALVVALWSHPWTKSDVGWVMPACAALAAWAVVRAVLAGTPRSALSYVTTLAGVAGVLVVARRIEPSHREQLALAVVGIGVLAAVAGWVGVAWRIAPWALPAAGLWRASSTLTYANAAAGLLAPLAVLALALLLARPGSSRRATALVLLLVGLGATLSRGGALALVAGLIVVSLLTGVRSVARAAAPSVLGAAVALAALAPSFPATARAHPLWAVTGLAAGLAVTIAVGRLQGWARWTALLVGIILIAALLVIQGGASTTLHTGAGRLTFASPGRIEAARAALHLTAGHPLIGVGPGHARFFWVTPDGRGLVEHYAHNEYLQVLAELGAVGLLLLIALFVSVAATLRKSLRTAHSRVAWVGAVAALSALTVHSAVDFLWQLPAIPLTGALLVGLAIPHMAPSPPTPREWQ